MMIQQQRNGAHARPRAIVVTFVRRFVMFKEAEMENCEERESEAQG